MDNKYRRLLVFILLNPKVLVFYHALKGVVCLGLLETEILTIAFGNCPLPKSKGLQEFLYHIN